ncbi:amidohydrolase [Aminicella lysinilytica]|uniref:Amidohydrolase family protein n=1 Tax=Aminicella lysinilytica TaxID=433323 RepID=A0A4R6Q1U8_9FIRM|nr:amidohydrolase family protein [Aminicella lysinilytica]TDP55957.1 amidohydrolase family protein [Aminicella lysinilytica]
MTRNIQFPTREDLDKVCPDNPVVMYRVCMHCLWVNTKALELAGITDDTKDPLGGEIIRDEKGVATGVLTDAATQAVDKIIPPYTVDNVMHMLPLIEKTYLKNGITTVVDLGAGFLSPAGPAQGDTMIKALKKSYEEDKVKLRSYVYVRPGELLDEYYKNGPEIGLYDDRLTVRGQKIFADGTLGARSAWLLEDYSDRPGHKGNNRMSSEELESLVKKAYDAGFQTTIHGIGERLLI